MPEIEIKDKDVRVLGFTFILLYSATQNICLKKKKKDWAIF